MNEKKLSLVSVLLSVYFGMAPINQTLTLGNGSTVNKYAAVVIMGLLFFRQLRGSARSGYGIEMKKCLLPIAVYIISSLLWTMSFSTSFASLQSELQYMLFAYLVCCEVWSRREKSLFMFAIVAASTVYSMMLVGLQASGRATLMILNGDSADPNMLAVGIGFGVIVALRLYLASRSFVVRNFALAALGISLLGILSTGSRGGLLACMAGCFVVMKGGKNTHRKSGRMLLVLILGVVGLWMVITSRTSINSYVLNRYLEQSSLEGGNGRLDIWQRYFAVLNNNIYGYFIGYGFGVDRVAFSILRGSAWRPATHNDYISVICYGGVILFSLFYRMIKRVIRRARWFSNIAGLGILFAVLVTCLTLNCMVTPIWWNAVILAYIGLDYLEEDTFMEEYIDEE